MKKLGYGILAAFLAFVAATGVYDIATGQPIGSTTLALTPGSSTVAPAIRATGAPANISINLVPKGTGTVQIAGVPIVGSGGTFTSLNVNPGPLNVTGPLFVQPGTAVGLKRVGARIFHNTADASTVGLVLETLYTATIQANTLAVDGESLRVTYYATTAANANNKTTLLVYGGTTIWSVGPGAFNNGMVYVSCDIFRLSAVTQKALCTSTQGTTNANAAAATQLFFTLPGETLSGAVALLARGTTPTAAADLTARALTVDWYPVGQ